jgi:methionyl-tRNA synthetase
MDQISDYKMSEQSKRILVTSALPYVNNVPHLGNIVGCVLPADVYVRFMRSRLSGNEKEVLFVGGVDEYGTATEMKARESGISCKALCDANYEVHKKIYQWFNIDFDCYGRTSQPNGRPKEPDMEWPHTRITHEIFKKLCENHMIFEKEEDVMYCPDISAFVADRFVIGQCKYCGYDKADADQCEKCGKMLSMTEIIDPKYKPCPEHKLEIRKTTNLFIDTKKIWEEKEMTQWFDSTSVNWTKNAHVITRDLLSQGLLPRSITRDLEWGTYVPCTDLFGDKYKEKVFYVWYDGTFGYISITESSLGKQKSDEWWLDPRTRLVQFMAKDNVPFHSTIFPASLRGSGHSHSQIHDLVIASSEYLLYEGHKFSKSTGVGLFSDDVIKLSEQYNLSADYWRAYLMFIRPETSDSNFVLNEGGFVDFVNNILVNNFGNLLHRILCVAFQIHQVYQIDQIVVSESDCSTSDCSTSDCSTSSSTYGSLQNDLKTLTSNYSKSMNDLRLSEGLRIAFQTSTRLNTCINELKPWELIKSQDQGERDCLYHGIVNLYHGAIELGQMIGPFMPGFKQCIEDSFLLSHVIDPLDQEHRYQIQLPGSKPSVLVNMIKSNDKNSKPQIHYVKQ